MVQRLAFEEKPRSFEYRAIYVSNADLCSTTYKSDAHCRAKREQLDRFQ